MYPLVETIRIIEGIPQNLFWHQGRFEHSYEKLFRTQPKLKVEEALLISREYKRGNVKARFLYNKDSHACNYSRSIPIKIKSLKLIVDNDIDYSLKYTDRKRIVNLLEMKDDCDDILIVKNRRVTDSSIANIVFYDGRAWYTPLLPLLRGTCRERLISEGKIIPEEIMIEDLGLFSKFKLINAMNDFEEQEDIDISEIK